MRCLTPSECSEWLQQRSIIECPYGKQELTLQFEPPPSARKLTAFTRHLVDAFGDFSGALLQFTDWPLYQPDEMALIASLRRGHGEQRWLIDAPGHLFAPNEEAEAVGHFYLAATFDWNAYLYVASGAGTVYLWEGDLIDFWSCDGSTGQKVLEVVKSYELRVTSTIAA